MSSVESPTVRDEPRQPARAKRWLPTPVGDGYLGFNVSGVAAALDEGCRRLRVTPVGQPNGGYGGRNRGVAVETEEGRRCWLKVLGVFEPDNFHFRGEIEATALDGIPRPRLLASSDWRQDNTSWSARLSEYVPDEVVETMPWAGENAGRVSDDLIAELYTALDALERTATTRVAISANAVAGALRRGYDMDYTPDLAEWRPAHFDLQWSNLTAPRLNVLDWEAWGTAPPGYDALWLIAYSAKDPQLVARLENAFAAKLSTRAARLTRLAAFRLFLDTVEGGWIDPDLRAPILKLISKAEEDWRRRS